MISHDIKTIITSFEQAKRDYQWAYSKVGECDKETSDILHSLELDALNRNQRNKLATRLRRVRIERREHKNIVEMNDPVVTFVDSDKGRQMLNLLKEALGKTRKIEEYHSTRVYKKRLPDKTA